MLSHSPKSWLHSAGWGLAILSFINLFNYLDRFLVPALFESLKRSELQLSDTQLGLLMSSFLAVYTLVAPVFGALGDRGARPRLIAFGVGCWSLATTLSGLASNVGGLLAARASVGIGEAAYGTIAPSLLSDYFPAARRGRVMAIFFCAIPVGSALGYVVGGLMDVHFGWRVAFFVAGIPGMVLAILCWWIKDPPRGSQDPDSQENHPQENHPQENHPQENHPQENHPQETHPQETHPQETHPQNTGRSAPRTAGPRTAAQQTPGPPSAARPDASLGSETVATYLRLVRNRPYAFVVLGYAAYTFAVGGLASWMPAFLERVRGMPHGDATISFGYIVVTTGFIGTFIGGWLGDYFAKYSKQAYLVVSAVATLVAAPLVWFALTTPSSTTYLACMVSAQLLIFLSTGPINASIVNLVLPTQRASAVALSIFAIHLLGDAVSPYLIGAMSDATSLAQAVKIVPIAVVLSGALWVWAAHEQAKAG